MQFAEFVNAWLAQTGWSLTRLAAATGVSQSLMSRWLSADPHRRVRPSPRNLEKLARVTGVPYEDFLRLTGYLPSRLTRPPDEPLDPDLAAVNAAWPRLDEKLRYAIKVLAGVGARVLGPSEPQDARHTLDRPKSEIVRPARRQASQSVRAMIAEFGLQPTY